MDTISELSSLNVSVLNTSLMKNLSCVKSGRNQNLNNIANTLNLSLHTNACFFY